MEILVSESKQFSEQAAALLRTIGHVRLEQHSRHSLKDALADVNILWVRLGICIDNEILNFAPNLELIVSPTTGLNHIDLAETSSRGIRVESLCGEADYLKNVRATAELTIGLALSLLRWIPAAVEDTKAFNWRRDLFRGNELYKKTVGLMGYGRLGRIVARYFTAFDCRVLAHDPHVPSREMETDVEWASKSTLLAESDIISLHVNWTTENDGIFGKEEFFRMKSGSRFINTSRGELVDEPSLLDALSSGHIAGAALDVIRNEIDHSQIRTNPLIEYAAHNTSLILTPHIGGCTTESMEKTEIYLAEKICHVMS